MEPTNLFDHIPDHLPSELLEILWETSRFRLERIVSRGHSTPPNQWYDQDTDEWVVLLTGAARLQIAGQPDLIHLKPGDHLFLPAHLRHRVAWTDPDHDSVWLALHAPADSTSK